MHSRDLPSHSLSSGGLLPQTPFAAGRGGNAHVRALRFREHHWSSCSNARVCALSLSNTSVPLIILPLSYKWVELQGCGEMERPVVGEIGVKMGGFQRLEERSLFRSFFPFGRVFLGMQGGRKLILLIVVVLPILKYIWSVVKTCNRYKLFALRLVSMDACVCFITSSV